MLRKNFKTVEQAFWAACKNFFGGKQVSEIFFFKIMLHIKKLTGLDPMEVMIESLQNLYPLFALRYKRVSGIKYKIPMILTHNKAVVLAVRLLLKGALERHEVKLEEKIACEIIDAFNKVGSAYKMRELLYSDIDESRSFLRYLK